MKTLRNFTQKLNLNASKIANLSNIHSIKGGVAPESGSCGNEKSDPSNTYTLLCGIKDTVDTQ